MWKLAPLRSGFLTFQRSDGLLLAPETNRQLDADAQIEILTGRLPVTAIKGIGGGGRIHHGEATLF
jgi:uncharacterized heparinase superfamily protein